MNIKLLYTVIERHKVCRLCNQELVIDGHTDQCPGIILEDLTYEIRIKGPNCMRGCCGYTDFGVSGSDFEMLIKETEEQEFHSECVSANFTARMIYELPNPREQILNVRSERVAKEDALKAKEKTENEVREREENRNIELEQLEKDKLDLAPEGYNRRKNEIEQSYENENE